MAHAEICPVCMGSGIKVKPNDGKSSNAVVETCPCHGCDGKGWVTVAEPHRINLKPNPWDTYGPLPDCLKYPNRVKLDSDETADPHDWSTNNSNQEED